MLKAIYIEWDDSQNIQGWMEEKDLSEPTLNKSIGWLVKETDKWVFISSSADLDGPTWIDPLAIPKIVIRRRSFIDLNQK